MVRSDPEGVSDDPRNGGSGEVSVRTKGVSFVRVSVFRSGVLPSVSENTGSETSLYGSGNGERHQCV